jgi:hypothetical protein
MKHATLEPPGLRKKNLARYATLAFISAFALGFTAIGSARENSEKEDRDIWFVHATDPHLFLKPDDKAKDHQEKLNKDALSDMLRSISSLPGCDGPPAFLVLTGDLGVDPCEICEARNPVSTSTPSATDEDKLLSLDDCLKVRKDKQDEQIKVTADVLGESPVQNIYLIAGNNDIAKESAGDAALKYFNGFVEAVQAKLDADKKNVRLHNLTQCYETNNAGSCVADVGEVYRLIGFPSYSFKNSRKDFLNPGESDVKAAEKKQMEAQQKQLKTFQQLLDKAEKDGKKVLVLSHTPAMDDPYSLGQQQYSGPRPTVTKTAAAADTTLTPAETAIPEEVTKALQSGEKKKGEGDKVEKAEANTPTTADAPEQKSPKSPGVSTWKVSAQVRDAWKEIVASDSVLAVLAGHLHDSHKEIYRKPYAWSNGSEYRATFGKLFLAPPLAIKKQDGSPVRARGFALVHLQPDRIESRLFWYDSETRAFTADSKPKSGCERRGCWRKCCPDCRAAIRWLWNLDTANPLERMAVLLIALLTAFLTIVAIWQIPPPDDPFPEVKKAAPGETKLAQPTVNAPSDSSPFSSRFGKTVVAGLAGLVAVEVTKTVGNQQPSSNTRWFYIVWFILFFFLLLLFLNLWRALVEALRSRFAIIYYPLPRPPEPNPEAQCQGQSGNTPPKKTSVRWLGRFWRWLVYRFYAGLHWLKSWLGVPLLTFADTFISLIQGKNQTTTKVFSDKIVDQQRNVLRVAKEIREQLNSVILGYLQDKTGRIIDPKDVRVNVSVLSADRTNVFYISKTRDSSRLSFPKRSVAWLSVFTGKIRWHKRSYDKGDLSKKITLFDNSAGTIPEELPQIPLNSYYQPRGGEDYEAFVVFPVPLSQRGLDSDYVKGAIHVSFSRETDFDWVWSFNCTPEEARAKATEEADAKIKAATSDSERQRLQQSRLADIEAAVKAATPSSCDPVLDKLKYQSEQRMLTTPWCKNPEVCATVNTSLRVLGEVLRGFNEHIYKSIAKSEQAD